MDADFESRVDLVLRRWPARGALVAMLAVLTAAGCTGAIGGATTGPGPTTDPNTGELLPPCVKDAPFAPSRLWQLTDDQYVNVVRDVFKVSITGADAEVTTGKSTSGEYTNISEGQQVNTMVVQAYQRTAAKLAPQILAKLPTLVPGCTASPDAACMDKFFRSVVPLAWRRPVTEADVKDLMDIYNLGLPGGAELGASSAIQAVLQTGTFLYRSEMGVNAPTATKAVALTPFELASALSFMFLESVPDAPLWAKAQDGSLTRPDVLKGEVNRLMARPEVQAALTKKVSFWAGMERIPLVQKDLKVFPQWTDTLRDSLYQSAQLFLQDVVANGTLVDLLTSNKVYVNKEIGTVYGLPGAPATGFAPVNAPDRAAGIFTQPSVLAATDHRQAIGDPIHRGLFVYNQFVCAAPIPDVPMNALAIAATMMGTERELAGMRAKLSCKACHGLFDPLGLTMEAYDPIGRYAPKDGMGATIDTSAEIVGLGKDLDGPVSGINELASRFQPGPRAANCAAESLGKYALGYPPEQENSCAIREVKTTFAKTGSFAEFFRALATSPAFLSRDPGAIK